MPNYFKQSIDSKKLFAKILNSTRFYVAFTGLLTVYGTVDIAQAQEFAVNGEKTTVSFNIPVEIHDVDPRVDTVYVECRIYGSDRNLDTGNMELWDELVGKAYIPNHELSGTVEVSGELDSERVESAKRWICDIQLGEFSNENNPLLRRPVPNYDPACQQKALDWKCGADGKPFRAAITGEINRE